MLGLAAYARHSLILRREFPRCRAIIERSREIFARNISIHAKDSYNESLHLWRLSESNTIQIGSVQYEQDWQKYQGQAHDLKCVGKGTLVWMADGTKKPIELISIGDYVQTLEGARRVTKTIIQTKKAVKLFVFNENNQLIGEQIQGITHELMTKPFEWVSHDKLSGACHRASSLPIQHRAVCKFFELFAPQFLAFGLLLLALYSDLLPSQEFALNHADRQFLSDLLACKEQAIQGNDCGSYCGEFPLFSQPLLRYPLQLKLLLALSHQWGFLKLHPLNGHGVNDELLSSSLLNYSDHYLSDNDLCGERIQLWSTLSLANLLQLTDVELQSPIGLINDDLGKTPIHNPHTCLYAHPYTMETRQTVAGLRACHGFSVELPSLTQLYDLTVDELNHYITDCGIINRNCWDELTEFSEMQFRKINIWNRHPDPNVRCRIVATGNPPTTVDGEWVLDYWGAFIDPDYDGDRAEQGSLVWFVRKYIGDEDVDVEIARTPLSEVKEYMARGEMPPRPIHEYTLPNGTVKQLEGRSRSFIGGKVEDNPVLMAKGYDKQLESLPIELRTRFRDGNFIRIVESTDLQVIPTAWVVAAMDRWVAYMGTKSLDYANAISIYRTKNQAPNMSAMGVDPSRGGDDETAIAIRFNDWIAPLHLTKGKYVEDGDAVRDLIFGLRIGNPQINIDVVGVGSSPYDSCKKMGWSVIAINGGAAACDRNGKPITDRTGLLRFRDMNAMLAWRLMEALDPQYSPTLMLPPDPKLKAELCSIRRASIDGGVVSIESKKEVKKRLGRSPDRADAVKYALLQAISMYAPNPKSQAAALGKVSEWR